MRRDMPSFSVFDNSRSDCSCECPPYHDKVDQRSGSRRVLLVVDGGREL